LKPGDAAPDFTVDATLGGKEFKISLSEALKKGPVVLYFYPKSFTSVCTGEAHEFAESIENFAAADANVIGLSGGNSVHAIGRPHLTLNVSARHGSRQAAIRGIAENICSWRAFRRLTQS
jgi:AhpC/TSA family